MGKNISERDVTLMDLQHKLNKLLVEKLFESGVTIEIKNTYPEPNQEAITLNSLPGSNITSSYMDNSFDQDINFEIRVQIANADRANKVSWAIDNFLKDINRDTLKSDDNSFNFVKLTVDNAPFMSEQGEDGFFAFLTDFKISIYVENI